MTKFLVVLISVAFFARPAFAIGPSSRTIEKFAQECLTGQHSAAELQELIDTSSATLSNTNSRRKNEMQITLADLQTLANLLSIGTSAEAEFFQRKARDEFQQSQRVRNVP